MVNEKSGSVLDHFHPVIADWFRDRFDVPTPAQERGWPAIRAGQHTLIAAPTGSGKTLASFLVCIDRLLRRWSNGDLEERPYVVYVSPLKALSNDIHRNLEMPLAEIRERAPRRDGKQLSIRAAIRTGDTPPAERQRMLRRPPHILVTTPESLYLLMTSDRGREILRKVETVIVDEIHAVARDKRGSHLALTLARLDALCPRPPVRIGLSATQRPIDEIARYLVGTHEVAPDSTANCQIVNVGHTRQLDLSVEVPSRDLEAVCSNEHWDEVYQLLVDLIQRHQSTLVFVNTRRLAERIAHRLAERLGTDAVASHHGSLSRQIRLDAEQRLKSGSLKAIVATASLEMGIDVGAIDLVCQIGSPRAIATFLQRVGRSGHSVGATPRGRLFPLTRDELIECLALVSAVRGGRLDAIEVPAGPLDILAQQVVAEVACQEYSEDALFQLCRSAWPYRNLSRQDFDAVVRMLSEGVTPTNRRGRQLHRDAIHQCVRPRRGARLAALTSGGAIPETAQFRVVTIEDETYVGDVDEDFAIESSSGDIFLLGNNSWRIARVREGQVQVHDAHGAAPTVPFWFGEAPGRTKELSGEVSCLRQEIHDRLPTYAHVDGGAEPTWDPTDVDWLVERCYCSNSASRQAIQYVAAQKYAVGLVPTAERILFERFFDESGGMQLVIHAPLGSRINRAWGFALRKRFCRSFDFELQAAATDDGIVLSLGPQHSFPIESLFRMVHPDNGRYLLEQAVLAVPMFQVRWRWNVTRALIVPRFRGGKKVPFYLQRYRSDDLLAAVFPETVGCLENHEGDVEIPDHPLVRQTMLDCLHEAMDLHGWIEVLEQIRNDDIELVARETREPSPFSHQLLNANPYAFLDGAGLEERRTRAITTRKGLPLEQIRDLAQLDSAAIDQCVCEAAPAVRNADELQEWLHESVVVVQGLPSDEGSWFPCVDPTDPWLAELVVSQRAFSFSMPSGQTCWAATERWRYATAIFPDAHVDASIPLLVPGACELSSSEALAELVRGWLGRSGPVTADAIAKVLGLATERVSAALEAIEGTGAVMRGHFRDEDSSGSDVERERRSTEIQWCDRSLLARIHRLTLEGLRNQVKPVDRATFVRFCLDHQHVAGTDAWGGPAAVREIVSLLQGIDAPAAAWESSILPARMDPYDPQWLDALFATGELTWGRLRVPRVDATDRKWSHQLTRNIPIGLLLREDMDWLLPPGPRMDVGKLRSDARLVYETLTERGALFWQQLLSATGLLNAQLESAMRELAAVGLVTCDSFEAVRQLIARPVRRRRTTKRRMESVPGRWSRFADVTASPSEDALVRWARQLLRRWGVIFRDLLARETAAPSWVELVGVLRRMEHRGEVRGGRFIGGVAGVQFATPEAVTALRHHRDDPAEATWRTISAADPLNVVGVLDPAEDRIPSIVGNSLVLQNGRCVAWKVGGAVQVSEPTPVTESQDMIRALRKTVPSR